eukprot:jgi/Phyca11/113761/e_gw1.24.499.1
MTCLAITQTNKRCSREAISTGYCKQHEKDYKIEMFKTELKRMHEKMRKLSENLKNYQSMIHDIDRLDYIKRELSNISSDRSFKYTIGNIVHKEKLESIFDLPFDEIMPYYESLLIRRNQICHRYTMGLWQQKPDLIKYRSKFK